MTSSSQNTQTAASTEPLPLSPSKRCQILTATAAPLPAASVEGAEYFVKLRGSTPLEAAQNQANTAQPQVVVSRHRTHHSDPDTFAVFTAAQGSTFGKSDSFAFLQSLGDDGTQVDNAAYLVAQAAAEVALGLDYEYSDDEDDMKMDRDLFDQSLNDAELMQLAHPLASLSS